MSRPFLYTSPYFSQAEKPDRQNVRVESYTLVCVNPYTAGYTDVSACLWRTVQRVILFACFITLCNYSYPAD